VAATASSAAFAGLGRVTQMVGQDGTSNYGYDATSQLTSATHTYQSNESYSYDANGNRTMTGYQTGTDNRLTNDGTYTYTYDGEGNRLTRTKTSTGEVTEYEWDYRNRLTKVTEKNAQGTTTQVVEYVYDVFNRRIGRKLDTSAPFDMANAVIERYVLDDCHNALASTDGGNVVLDFVDPDGSGAQAIAMSKRYLYGEAVDQLFAQEDLSKTLGDAARNLWPLVDNLGTVRDLAKQDGTIAVHYTYDSYGNVKSGDTSQTRYLYTSREFDTATKLQYNRARYYDAVVGRWLSQDPIGFRAGDVSLHRYVGNHPTMAADRSGMAEQGRLSKDEQKQQIERVREELDRFVKDGRITSRERNLRIEIATAAMSHRMEFSSTANPDLKYFYRDEDDDGYVVFRIRPGLAVEGIHSRVYRLGKNGVGSDTACTRAAQLLMLEGLARLAVSLGKVDEFERRAKDRTIDDFFPSESNSIQTFESDYDKGLDPGSLVPGDRVWMRNHRFDPRYDEDGYEGSNVIYIGKNADGKRLFVHMDTPFVETYEQLQDTVRNYSRFRRDVTGNYRFMERFSGRRKGMRTFLSASWEHNHPRRLGPRAHGRQQRHVGCAARNSHQCLRCGGHARESLGLGGRHGGLPQQLHARCARAPDARGADRPGR
jgi:RHS repeat-associated protein